MAVMIGSARIDENGNATGGKAGDQSGREVGTQSWYLHAKGWRVFRAKDPAQANKIAQDMQYACDNPHIGYDQNQRLTLYNVAKAVGFNCSKVTTNCETDCSALVRVCCAYAGIMLPDFNTSAEASTLLNSGAFTELTGKYATASDYLRRGDILVTKTKGHTVVVLTNGPKAEVAPVEGDRILKNGMSGPDVKELQNNLIKLGYDCGKWGADGDFGDATEMAVRRFQTQMGLKVDGQYGPKTAAALKAALDAQKEPERPEYVKIVGGNCYIREEPETSAEIRGVALEGTKYIYAGKRSEDGWLAIMYKDRLGWVSGKYGKLVE